MNSTGVSVLSTFGDSTTAVDLSLSLVNFGVTAKVSNTTKVSSISSESKYGGISVDARIIIAAIAYVKSGGSVQIPIYPKTAPVC